MKPLVITLLVILHSTFLHAENYVGKVSQIKPGFYRISYPNQSINIYFDYKPTNGFENILVESDLNEHEKNEIVWLLKEQIDQLPGFIIDQYLNIDIYPLQINDKYEYGLTLDNQVFVEVNRIKDGMSYKNSVKSCLAHQIAHLLEKDPTIVMAALNIKNYLNDLHPTSYEPEKNINKNIFDQGFVSKYASGELSGQYSSDEEFAELFAYMTCEENRLEIIEFINEHPNDLLCIKINLFIDFLSEQVASFDRAYFFRNENVAIEMPAYQIMSGELLLAAHENKSYESFNLNTLYTDVDDNDINREKEFKDVSTKKTAYESASIEDLQTYEYSDQLHTFSQNNHDENQENQNEQVKKKHKGTGAIIILTLIIFLSAL